MNTITYTRSTLPSSSQNTEDGPERSETAPAKIWVAIKASGRGQFESIGNIICWWNPEFIRKEK